ncbi:MAG: hypothetical protein Q9212_007313, partial [Teloschistes hypoglaucus]
MAPSTRQKARVDYTQRALEAAQQNQNLNQGGQGNGQAPSTHAQPQNTPVNRPNSRPKARDPRVNSEGRSKLTAIRKTPPGSSKQRRSFGWRRTRLPEFHVAKWRIRAGRPVIMLRLLNPDADTTMTDDSESFEQIEVDTESDHSIPFVHNTDQPQADGPPSDDNQSTSDDSGSDYEPPMRDDPPKSSNEPADDDQPMDDNQPTDGNQPADDTQPADVGQPADHDHLPGDEDRPISVSSSVINPSLKFASDYLPLPEDVPVRRLPIEGEPREADVTTYGRTFAKFIASPFGLWNKDTGERETGWVGQKPLGKGGYGVAGLWQKTLQDGTVKSMVIKQTRNQWWNGEKWESDVPDEVVALSTIKKQTEVQPTGCIEYFDYQRYPAREVHRIYMEYAPYGDLYRLISKYRAKKRLIPEPFIWDVFWRLSKACLAMANSRCGRDHPHCGEWVHLDIKPDNGQFIVSQIRGGFFFGRGNLFLTSISVFLAEKGDWDNDSYPFYATAKLGDFNGAACLHIEEIWNPLAWKGLGTPGYRPLVRFPHHQIHAIPSPPPKNPDPTNTHRVSYYKQEQQYFFATNPAFHHQVPNYTHAKRRYRHLKHIEYDHDPPPLTSYTNVWGVGAVIFELMTLKRATTYLYTTPTTQNPSSTEALPHETIDKIITNLGYSADLVNLVAACLRPNPVNRPTAGAMEEESFEGRFAVFGDLHDWWDDGDGRLDKFLIPWDDLDGMEERE